MLLITYFVGLITLIGFFNIVIQYRKNKINNFDIGFFAVALASLYILAIISFFGGIS